MARIAYVDLEDHPELAPVVERMTSARRGNLLNIYRMLLNSPQLAESWFGHMNAVRWGTTLSGRLRELAIIRVGYLNDAAYIIRQHVPKLAEADGVSRDECDALRDWPASARFDAAERAALTFVDEVTRHARAGEATFAALRAHYDERSILELAVLIGTYNMHARVMNALDVDLETG